MVRERLTRPAYLARLFGWHSCSSACSATRVMRGGVLTQESRRKSLGRFTAPLASPRRTTEEHHNEAKLFANGKK